MYRKQKRSNTSSKTKPSHGSQRLSSPKTSALSNVNISTQSTYHTRTSSTPSSIVSIRRVHAPQSHHSSNTSLSSSTASRRTFSVFSSSPTTFSTGPSTAASKRLTRRDLLSGKKPSDPVVNPFTKSSMEQEHPVRRSRQSLEDDLEDIGGEASVDQEERDQLLESLTKRMGSVREGNGFKIGDIVLESIPPPPEYDTEVPSLAVGIRQALQYEGPVSLGKIDDDMPYIDANSIQRHITQPEDINWDAIPPFITSSRDPSLLKLAEQNGAKLMGSTSSVSSLLSQFHFCLTDFAPIKIDDLSHWFKFRPTSHTRASVKPSISFLRKRSPVVWGIDNPPSGDPKQNQILIDLGKSLERHLTFEGEDFNRIFVKQRDKDGNPLPNQYTIDEIQESEAHAFMKTGSLLLRSQLDCEDLTVRSNKKVFDLKTRATLPIRLDVGNYKNYTDYKLTSKNGLFNSFEREFYDMGRAAFLKYSFQCRIGDMGGVMVAYHNTQEIFGFEYIPVESMDKVVYGDSDRADFVYRHALNMMEGLTNRVIEECRHETRDTDTIRLSLIAHNQQLLAFAETVPSIDLDDPVALDEAFACTHRGHVYVDWLTEGQARAALERRGMDTSGSRAELISRLEGVVAVPSVLYQPPTEEFVRGLFDNDHMKVFTIKPDMRLGANNVTWSTLTDIANTEVSYKVRPIDLNLPGMKGEMSRRYQSVLANYALIDRGPEDTSMLEVVDIIQVGGVSVPVTKFDLVKADTKKQMMDALMKNVESYQDLQQMEAGPDRDRAEQDFISVLKSEGATKLMKRPRNRRVI